MKMFWHHVQELMKMWEDNLHDGIDLKPEDLCEDKRMIRAVSKKIMDRKIALGVL